MGPSLVSVTGFEKFDRFANEDFDAGPNRLADTTYSSDISVFSTELRLVSDGSGPLNWIAGIYFSDDQNDTFDVFGMDHRFLGEFWTTYSLGTTTYAAFGQVDWDITEAVQDHCWNSLYRRRDRLGCVRAIWSQCRSDR